MNMLWCHVRRYFGWSLASTFYLICITNLNINQLQEKSEASCSSAHESSSSATSDHHLLTCGRAWAISLTLRDSMNEEILKACFPTEVDEATENLLYRLVHSSVILKVGLFVFNVIYISTSFSSKLYTSWSSFHVLESWSVELNKVLIFHI